MFMITLTVINPLDASFFFFPPFLFLFISVKTKDELSRCETVMVLKVVSVQS